MIGYNAFTLGAMRNEQITAVASESCSLCGAREADLVLEKKAGGLNSPQTFRLWRCRSCELVRTEPRLTPDALEPHYGAEYWGEIDCSDLDWIRRDQMYRTNFLHRFRSQGKILDVGCGPGFFLRALDPGRWDRYGVEPMPIPHQKAARWLGSDRIWRGELTTSGFPRQDFDVVTFWDAFEHVANPRAVLEETSRLLRPGGLVLFTLPNYGGYQARHFGEDWYGLSLPHHLAHYTRASLARLLETCGFSVTAIEDRSGPESYHDLKYSLLNRLIRLHGRREGRFRYLLLKPLLHPWEWISTRRGGGASLQVCAAVGQRRVP